MNILITGGAGYLGRAILAERPWDATYTVLSRDETKHEALRWRFPDVRTVIGDARDATILEPLVHGMDLVIAAHAIKYVDEAEHNVMETIDVNVRGTAVVMAAAARAGVERVIVVSTDKATAPLNTYGATKQLCERMVGEFARRWPHTRFTAVRYGNVVGSTGSVTWKWYHAIERSEAITMTDPRMTRFWMSPREAVAAVVQSDQAPNGTVTIPLCGAMAMGDVAEAMGATKVKTIGLRPGERMDEMLFSAEEAPRAIHDGNWVYLRPAYEPGQRTELIGYSSAKPLRWIDGAELRGMIGGASVLW